MSDQDFKDLFGIEEIPEEWLKPYERFSYSTSLEGHRLLHVLFYKANGWDTRIVKSKEQVEAEMEAGTLIRDKAKGLQYSDFNHLLPILHPLYSEVGRKAGRHITLLRVRPRLRAMLTRMSSSMNILVCSSHLAMFTVKQLSDEIDTLALEELLKNMQPARPEKKSFKEILEELNAKIFSKRPVEIKDFYFYPDPALIRHQKEQNRLRAKYHSRKK